MKNVAAETLQELHIVNLDCPIWLDTVRSLVAYSSFKHSWKLLYFIPGAHVLGKEENNIFIYFMTTQNPLAGVFSFSIIQ